MMSGNLAHGRRSYNYPGVTNQVIVAPESYTELAQHPNIVGCKMYDLSSPSLPSRGSF